MQRQAPLFFHLDKITITHVKHHFADRAERLSISSLARLQPLSFLNGFDH